MQQRIAFADGSPTVLESWGAGGAKVLCLHGMTSSRDIWARLGNRIGSRATVYAYDQRGHGDAPYGGGPANLQTMLDDFAAVLGALGPIELLVGASLGGVQALGAGRRHPVPKVVAVDPFFRSVKGDWGRWQLATVKELQSLSKPERDAEMKRRHPGVDPEDFASRIRAIDTLSYPWLERFMSENAVDEGGWNHAAELANYPRPLFVMIAGVDSIIPPDERAVLEERAGPNVRTKTFPGHGHALHRSAFDEFAALVEEFMSEP